MAILTNELVVISEKMNWKTKGEEGVKDYQGTITEADLIIANRTGAIYKVEKSSQMNLDYQYLFDFIAVANMYLIYTPPPQKPQFVTKRKS